MVERKKGWKWVGNARNKSTNRLKERGREGGRERRQG